MQEDKELKDLHKFAKELVDLMTKFLSVKNKDLLKKIIEQGNMLPAYGGLAIFEIIHSSNAQTLELFCIEILEYFNNNKTTEKGTDFIKDLSETISAFYFFVPEATLRKILIKKEDTIFNYLITECKNRSGVYSVISCRYGDLYLASKKTQEKFIQRIVEFFTILEHRVTEANNILPEIPDALNLSLKETKKLTFAFKEENKKTSLDQLKIILTRKIDLGNLLYAVVIGNESAVEAVLSSVSFPDEIIIKCLPQLKLQQLIEIAIFLEPLNVGNKYLLIKSFLEEKYNVSEGDYISKTRELVTKYDTSKCGILIRNAMMMPIEEEAKDAKEAVNGMQTKLTTLSNNQTATISQASLSITVALSSKTSLFATFIKEYEEKKHGNLAGGFASKLQDKDFTKKIKESDIAAMNFDQITCKTQLCILVAMKEEISPNFEISQKEDLISSVCKVLFANGVIISKAVVSRFVNIFITKIPRK
jgi:hypothetical protein